MMTIADIFDALTATDRPYKRAVPWERALDILQMEANEGMLDEHLLESFIGARVFEALIARTVVTRFADSRADLARCASLRSAIAPSRSRSATRSTSRRIAAFARSPRRSTRARSPASSTTCRRSRASTVHYDPTRVAGDPAESPYDRLVAQLDAAAVRTSRDDDAARAAHDRDSGVLRRRARARPRRRRAATRDHAARRDRHAHGRATISSTWWGSCRDSRTSADSRNELATPRRSSPRTAVPAGTVGIGGQQTGVYPLESPGGWNLIGRTPLRDLRHPSRTGRRCWPRAITCASAPISLDEFERWPARA